MIHEEMGYDIDKIPECEPVFLLRGTDTDAPTLVRIWVLLKGWRLSEAKKKSVLAHADEMEKNLWKEMGGAGCAGYTPHPKEAEDE